MKTILQLTSFISCLLIFNLSQAQCPNLVWSDEFDGDALDLTKWEPMIGDGCDYGLCGWGNNELEYYKAENAVVSNGTLKIIAKEERVKNKKYTSARLRTLGLADFTYGRFEARIKVCEGQGLWPAFWMLSSNEPYGSWPQSGEIDVMEVLGQNPATNYGTIHYGDPYPDDLHKGQSFDLYNAQTFADDFHVYAVEWEPGVLRWYIDDILYSTITADDIAPANWPFDETNQMHMLLNLAVGGNWPGSPDATTIFPAQMEVDYVRVYDGSEPSISGERLVSYQATNQTYTINNTSGTTSYNWSVPSDALITSGQGSNSITVDFGSTSDNVTCDVTTSCETKMYKIDVTVEPNFIYDYTFENFDSPGNISLNSATGTLTEINNIDPSGINTSALIASYTRNSAEQYDNISYSTSAIVDASIYATRQEKFYMDIYTSAPVGTEILIQLESADATTSNYPTGRHSRYLGVTTTTNQWERIHFGYLDSPDPSTSDADVTNIILLFASNTFTSDTYYWDNFDSYKADVGGSGNTAPTVSITSPADGTNYSSLTTITISADATDSDGSVSQVEFFENGTSIGTDNTSPYSIDWQLPGDGTYSLSAIATDNNGATTQSSTVGITVNTSGGSDTQAPTAPGNLSATATASSVDLSWTASTDNVGVTGYNVYQDGVLIGTTTTLSYSVIGLKKHTSYTFGVSAFDAAGNESQLSTVSVRTSAKSASLGISPSSKDQLLLVYGNKGIYHVQINMEIQEGSFSVVSLLGKVIINQKLNKNNTIDLSNYSNGIYIINVMNDGNYYSRKILNE